MRCLGNGRIDILNEVVEEEMEPGGLLLLFYYNFCTDALSDFWIGFYTVRTPLV